MPGLTESFGGGLHDPKTSKSASVATPAEDSYEQEGCF